MPYKDPEKRREKSREWDRKKYREDPEYRERRKAARRAYGKEKYATDPAYRARVLANRKAVGERIKADPVERAEALAERRAWANNRPLQVTLHAGAKQRAKREGSPFDLLPSDIEVPSHCPVLGIELRRGAGAHSDASPSLDRIDPTKGYVKGNVAVISYRANRVKNDGTAEEHEAIAEFMRSRLTP